MTTILVSGSDLSIESEHERILDQGVLVALKVSAWSGRVKVPSGLLDTDADPAWLRSTKALIDKNALHPVERVRNEARTWLYAKSLPFPISGVIFIPVALITETHEKLTLFARQFQEAAAEFSANYNVFVSQAEERLNVFCNRR